MFEIKVMSRLRKRWFHLVWCRWWRQAWYWSHGNVDDGDDDVGENDDEDND